MSFLYINSIPSKNIASTLSKSYIKHEYSFSEHVITAFQYKNENSREPFFENEFTGGVVIVSGWFLINDQINNYRYLLDLIETIGVKSALQKVEAGTFSGCYFNPRYNSINFFQDPAALLSHYYSTNGKPQVSPEVASLVQRHDPAMEDFLSSQGHLYSYRTVDSKVRRVLPFEVLEIEVESIVSSYSPEDIINYSFAGKESKGLDLSSHELFRKHDLSTVCALSSGFDSRYITLKYEPNRSYTWGPMNSQDQIIAKKIADELNIEHTSFSYLTPQIVDSDRDIATDLFKGVVRAPMTQLIANYRYSKELSCDHEFSLDGYLGGVFQRGSYANFGGLVGEMFKIFPGVYKHIGISDKYILRNRYKNLSKQNFEYLYEDYLEKTALIKKCVYSKVSFYEVFYGRGARYMSTGGIVMNSLYYSVFAPFLSKSYLNYFFSKDFDSIVDYSQFKILWAMQTKSRGIHFLSSLKSEGGFSPKTPKIYIPLISFLGRVNTHINPMRKNYLRE